MPTTQPLSQPIEIVADTVTEVIVNFAQLGNLRVGTSPSVPATIFCNGYPMNEWGFWANLEAGVYTITFHDIGGYQTPSPEVVTVTPGAMTYFVGEYIILQTLVYDANGGSGTIENSVQPTGKTSTLRANTFTKTGYSFTGWNTAADGSDTAYADQTTFTMPAGGATLYAQWMVNQYTISFESNGGSAVTAITQDYGTAVSAPTDPTRTGYTFAGWYSDAGLTTPYTFTTIPAGDITVYAKWTIRFR